MTACVGGRAGFDGSDNIGSTTACGESNPGQSRWNTELNIAEICDGERWRPVAGELDMPVLLLSPDGTMSFAVSGTGNPARSPWSVLAIRNVGNVGSSPLQFALSNSTHFELDSTDCEGVSLATGAQCDVRLRALSSASSVFEGVVVVNVDNRPMIRIEGVATLTCPVGAEQTGGLVADCAEGGYYLIASPSGCENVLTEPDCSPTLDRTSMNWGPENVSVGVSDREDGRPNTQALASTPAGTYAAADFCDGLILAGYDDWYLPAVEEAASMVRGLGDSGGFFNGGIYWTSTESSTNRAFRVSIPTGETSDTYKGIVYFIRCTRRDYVTPTVQYDRCAANTLGSGGAYVGCGAAYDLIMQPAGCDGSVSEPTCDGGEETVRMPWASSTGGTAPWAKSLVDGPQNSVDLQALADLHGMGSYPPAEYCMAMVYNGYDDWYLPAPAEVDIALQLQRSGAGLGFDNHGYWTSATRAETNSAQPALLDQATSPGTERENPYHVRCMRRDGQPLPNTQVHVGGCQVGAAGAGGTYFSCGDAASLVLSPGGCASNTGPCSGGADAVMLSWGGDDTLSAATSDSDGALNTQRLDLLPGVGNYPAAEFCAGMQMNGYDDWYLPAKNQAEILGVTSHTSGFLSLANYWTSTEFGPTAACYLAAATATLECAPSTSPLAGKSTSNGVRCIRTERHAGPADGCAVGAPGPGGTYAVCNGEQNLVVMPAGCDGSTSNPACVGSDGASTRVTFGGATLDGAIDRYDGSANTAALDAVAGVLVRPAAEYCANMFYGGFDDWYLPALAELGTVVNVVPLLGGFSTGGYWSSTVSEVEPDSALSVAVPAGGVQSTSREQLGYVRCVRRD